MTDRRFTRWLSVFLAAMLVLPAGALAQDPAGAQTQAQAKAFPQEQLDQLLAPVALYPDSLLTQLLMASTYPLEVVKANNWAKANKDLKGEELTKALEKQEWDPSVKSLVNFPQVLQMMSDKIEWTQKLGDAFLAQQKDVLDTVQNLRKKAYEAGNLKSTKEQTVTVDGSPQIIVVEAASPQVVYVPSYNPTVVYGTWWYPAYPPYPVYPPGYAAGAFFTGVAVGVAWGYAWGHCDWHGGDVNIDIDRNTNINRDIDRGKYKEQRQGQGGRGQLDSSGKGKWQHDSSHRQGVSYRDTATANKYGQGSGRQAPRQQGGTRVRDRSGRRAAGHHGPRRRHDRYERDGMRARGGGSDRGGSTDRGAEAEAATTPSAVPAPAIPIAARVRGARRAAAEAATAAAAAAAAAAAVGGGGRGAWQRRPPIGGPDDESPRDPLQREPGSSRWRYSLPAC